MSTQFNGWNVKFEGKDGKEEVLDLRTGRIKTARQISTMDWLLINVDILFKRRNDKVEATCLNLVIVDDKEYEAKGVGDTANEAVKDLAEDLKNETVVITRDSGLRFKYKVNEKLEFVVEPD